ncbi:MAG: hypothetical protein ACXVX8_16940 [Blastococcus sp.]
MKLTGPEDPTPDTALLETATDSAGGGDLGVHLGPGDLEPDEERLLAALERDAAALQVDPVENFVATLVAARDEAVPGTGGVPDDGLTPLFAAPDLGEG